MEEKNTDAADHWQMIGIGLIGVVAFAVVGVLFDQPLATGIMYFLAGTSGIIYATGIALWALRTFHKKADATVDPAEPRTD